MTIPVAPAQRRNDLDWLRVLAILSVFVYHSFRFFNIGDWSVKNPTTYSVVERWLAFLGVWMMPLIFFISGASVFLSLGKGGPLRFLKDKALRLLVPLAVGAFSHASLQVYLERVSHRQFAGSYLDFLPHYFDGLYFEGGTGNFAFHGMHLWYLLFLFLFCLVLLPFFFWCKSGLGARALHRLGDLLALPGAVFLLALPTILFENVLSHKGLLGLNPGGWGMEHYFLFFFAGFIGVSHPRLRERVIQVRWLALALAVVAVAASLLSTGEPDKHPDLASWGFILAILGFGAKHLTARNAFLGYASEAVLPFYILHQTVLLWIGFFVVGWAIPDPLKYMVITPTSFVVIMLLYEFLVRRINVLRVLFGMHPRPRMTAGSAGIPSTPQAAGI